MATASLNSSPKIRQIAILVSSVEAAVARQLLLHLPTDVARQVRAMVTQLGTVTAAERQAILAEFQRNASRSTATPEPSLGNPQPMDHGRSGFGNTGGIRMDSGMPTTAGPHAVRPAGMPMEDETAPAWTRLSTPALVRFVKGERSIVGALVISRLKPEKGVDVLRQLPREMHRDILKRISQLQDVDPTAMAAIDEHLVERLSEYQQLIESEQANLRRLTALLAAAPPEWQHEWQSVLDEPEHIVPELREQSAPVAPQAEPMQAAQFGNAQPANSTTAEQHPRGKVPLVSNNPQRNVQATIAELYGNAVITAVAGVSNASTANAALNAHLRTEQPAAPASLSPAERLAAQFDDSANSAAADSADADDESSGTLANLSFNDTLQAKRATQAAAQAAVKPYSAVSLQPLLELAPSTLAQLLSSVEARTVLLALAGSTPAFMRRFNELLQPTDAKALNDRLQKLGPINLREVDTAQQQLMQQALPFLSTNRTANSQRSVKAA